MDMLKCDMLEQGQLPDIMKYSITILQAIYHKQYEKIQKRDCKQNTSYEMLDTATKLNNKSQTATQSTHALFDRSNKAIIGLYRDVSIAAIASSRTRLATLTGAMCKTSQCELRSLRVNSGMLNVIRIVTYYTLPPLESPDSFWIAMAISR